jgi:hypothetical protein
VRSSRRRGKWAYRRLGGGPVGFPDRPCHHLGQRVTAKPRFAVTRTLSGYWASGRGLWLCA